MTLKPYYSEKNVTIYHGRCEEILPQLADASFLADMTLTDPPYFKQTHDGARKNTSDGPAALVDFHPIDGARLRSTFSLMAPLTRRWVVSTVDYNAIPVLQHPPPDGLKFVRFGIWVKPGSAPQFTGDRPGMGWEAIAFLHKADHMMAWNGGGRDAVFQYPVVRGGYPTQKPLGLIKDIINLFTNPGDTVLDPFMGSGTCLRASKDLGRRAVGIEMEERACEIAVKRLAQEVLPFYAEA